MRSLMAALVLAMAAPTLSATALTRHAYAKSPFVTIPAGTTLHVRLAQPVHVNFTRPGAIYRGVLDRSVSTRRSVLIPRGADVRLQAVGVNRSGRYDRVLLTAKSVSFGGRRYRIITSDVQARGTREGGRGPARRGVTRAALGTAVGGIAGGAPGAAVGAAVGGTSGIAAGSRGGERVRIPANTRLQFRLNDAVTVRH
jgi:hypothetical protein